MSKVKSASASKPANQLKELKKRNEELTDTVSLLTRQNEEMREKLRTITRKIFETCGMNKSTTPPAERARPALRSAPHCRQLAAVALLRVPQKAQWRSGPVCARLIWVVSWVRVAAVGASNCTSAGWAAPQPLQVVCVPGLRVLQTAQDHSNST